MQQDECSRKDFSEMILQLRSYLGGDDIKELMELVKVFETWGAE